MGLMKKHKYFMDKINAKYQHKINLILAEKRICEEKFQSAYDIEFNHLDATLTQVESQIYAQKRCQSHSHSPRKLTMSQSHTRSQSYSPHKTHSSFDDEKDHEMEIDLDDEEDDDISLPHLDEQPINELDDTLASLESEFIVDSNPMDITLINNADNLVQCDDEHITYTVTSIGATPIKPSQLNKSMPILISDIALPDNAIPVVSHLPNSNNSNLATPSPSSRSKSVSSSTSNREAIYKKTLAAMRCIELKSKERIGKRKSKIIKTKKKILKPISKIKSARSSKASKKKKIKRVKFKEKTKKKSKKKKKKKKRKKVKFKETEKEKRAKSKKRKFSSIDDGAMDVHHARVTNKRRRIMPEDRKRCSSLNSLRVTKETISAKKFELPKITKMPPARRKPSFAVHRARRSSLAFL